MDFNEFKAALEAVNGGSDLINFHLSQLDAEKQRGISEVQRRNKEAENLRRFKMGFEALGYDGNTDINEFVSGLRQTTEEVSQKSVTVQDLQKQLQKLSTDFKSVQSELLNERQVAQELKGKAKRETIKASLIDALKDKVYGHDFLTNDLINSGRVDLTEDNKIVFLNEDKSQVGFEDGISKLLESRPDIVKNNQRPGGAAQPTSGGNGSGPTTDQDRLQRLRKLGGGLLL